MNDFEQIKKILEKMLEDSKYQKLYIFEATFGNEITIVQKNALPQNSKEGIEFDFDENGDLDCVWVNN